VSCGRIDYFGGAYNQMIKLVCLIGRPETVSHDAFVQWWLGHHAKVAGQLPGLRHYIISVAPEQDSGQVPPFDGVAELWFDSPEAMNLAFASEKGKECAREDRQLIGRRIAFVTEEHIII